MISAILRAAIRRWEKGIAKESWSFSQFIDQNINKDALYVKDYFRGFKYIIQLDPDKALTHDYNYDDYVVPEFREFMYPRKSLSDHCVVRTLTINTQTRDGQITKFPGRMNVEQTFAATNNEQDAFMIKLRFS